MNVASVLSSGFAGACATPFFVTKANLMVRVASLAARVARTLEGKVPADRLAPVGSRYRAT
jgi:hypothetical protein